MKTEPPKRIYLQWEGTDDPPSPNDCEPKAGDITWCQDRQFESDIEYVAAAGLRDLVGELAEVLEDNAETLHHEWCAPTSCICGLTELLDRAEKARKPE